MVTSSHCTVPPRRARFDLLWLLPLTVAVVLIHGYHPWAEDGGLYVAGVEYTLQSSLFPHDRAFVTAHLHYSVFAPVIAALVRSTHLSLAIVLFCAYLLSTALMLLAGLLVVRQCFASRAAHWTGVCLLAAWWTLPVAGTSLLLMDPYVTARSFSTPLCLLAVAAALRPWRRPSHTADLLAARDASAFAAIFCGLSLLAAGVFHPLMAAYGVGFVILLRLVRHRRSLWIWAGVVVGTFATAACLQIAAQPETPAMAAAAYSRYYWFLSQWQWYEWLGVICPLGIFAALLRWTPAVLSLRARVLCGASVALGLLSIVVASAFAREHLLAHSVARLQPLREFLLLYACMILLLGGLLGEFSQRASRRFNSPLRRLSLEAIPAVFIAAMALLFFFVQRASFPASLHVELPGRTNPNPWAEAFLWSREHTPPDALFALDARYVNTQGEDAQTFRAIAQRSTIPDFSKDGGEAAITPRLASEWQRSARATRHLSEMTDAERDRALQPFGVDWVVLHREAVTRHPCPYQDSVVKVCRLF